MRFYKRYAFALAKRALDHLNFAEHKDSITHLILTTCTGFYAPGINLQVVEHYGLHSFGGEDGCRIHPQLHRDQRPETGSSHRAFGTIIQSCHFESGAMHHSFARNG